MEGIEAGKTKKEHLRMKDQVRRENDRNRYRHAEGLGRKGKMKDKTKADGIGGPSLLKL